MIISNDIDSMANYSENDGIDHSTVTNNSSDLTCSSIDNHRSVVATTTTTISSNSSSTSTSNCNINNSTGNMPTSTSITTPRHHRNSHQQSPSASSVSMKPIIGLIYLKEFVPNGNNIAATLGSTNGPNELQIGTIILPETFNVSTFNVRQLRQLIVQQSLFNLDNSYVFLTNFGSPISINQELLIELKYLINSENNVKFKRHHFGSVQIRCPIVLWQQSAYLSESIFIGHILTDYNNDLKMVRTKIEEVLKEATSNNKQLLNAFHFVHSFYYAIHRLNEPNMQLVDIIQNNCIFIRFDNPQSLIMDMSNNGPVNGGIGGISSQYLKSVSNDDINSHLIDDQTDTSKTTTLKPNKKASILRRKTSRHAKLKSSQKQIMISYARQEAAEHALQLKASLIKMGYSVYLDVHEIEMGGDWQDSLNSAIQNCHYFVPLITKQYGRTQWTNREVKLADVLRKHIIPINFLDFWPPECLAIQFATTQYILWRTPSADDSIKDNDKKIWDFESLEQVTKQLVGQINKLSSASSHHHDIPEEREPSNEPSSSTPESTEKPLIVISAHPNQIHVSNEIKRLLSKKYHVWCSTDVTESSDNQIKSNDPIGQVRDSIYDPTLSPIMEESIHVTHATQDYARMIAENSKQRPKSVPNNENVEFKQIIKKKDLSRVTSYSGEGSYLSSISPDKIKQLKAFQEKVLSSSLVIIVASDQYYKSRTSEQHVYYCGQRKKTILVQCDKSPAPVWFSKLMSHDTPSIFDKHDFSNELMNKINRVMDPTCKYVDSNVTDFKIKYLTDFMKKNLPNLETCVYVLGSRTGKLENQRIVDICTEIGKELAQVANINIITNGFYGSSDIVALNFSAQRKNCQKECTSSVIHIVPERDEKDYSKKCRQDKDGSFEKVNYGQTVFIGDSIKERDSVIARLLDICILIEGGQDAAQEVEEFLWNDHFVVPVCCKSGLRADSEEMPTKIFQCPNGVREREWAILSNVNATANEVAKAVVHVICDLKKAIHEHAASKNVNATVKKSNSDKPLKKRTAARKRLNIELKNVPQIDEMNDSQKQQLTEPNSPEKVLPIFTQTETMPIQSDDNYKGFKDVHQSKLNSVPMFLRKSPLKFISNNYR